MPSRACVGCGRPGQWGRRSRCPGCRKPAPPRRAYSDTALERRVRAEVLELYGWTCTLYCGRPIDPDAAPRSDGELVLAHVISHADGGPFTAENIRPAHRICNLRAGR